jgi:hypothetical protein
MRVQPLFAEEGPMKRWTLSMLGMVTLLSISLTPFAAMAGDDDRLTVSVAFGRGLNTAQPGNAVNHAILPDKIKVTQDGVVQFLVAGFHQAMVYNPGTKRQDIIVPTTGTFINDLTDLYYQGIAPVGGPLDTAGTTNPLNGSNRVESITFSEPGTYLVICNVRGHFLDGMFAFIKVKEAEED